MNSKSIRYFGMDTRGTADFTVSMFVDRFTVDAYGTPSPALTMLMTGGDSGGFGDGDSGYGSGRMTNDERLYAWPAKLQLAKMQFSGATTTPLRFVSLNFLILRGGYNR